MCQLVSQQHELTDSRLLAHSEGVRVSPFNYGFILRSRNPEATGAFSDILCVAPHLLGAQARLPASLPASPGGGGGAQLVIATSVQRLEGVP